MGVRLERPVVVACQSFPSLLRVAETFPSPPFSPITDVYRPEKMGGGGGGGGEDGRRSYSYSIGFCLPSCGLCRGHLITGLAC